MESILNPVLDAHDPTTKKSHKLWRFPNNYGVSAVKQPPSGDVRGTDGNDWSVAIIKFNDPHSWEYAVDYNNPLCMESDDLFCNVPDEQVDSIVLLASRMEECLDQS